MAHATNRRRASPDRKRIKEELIELVITQDDNDGGDGTFEGADAADTMDGMPWEIWALSESIAHLKL